MCFQCAWELELFADLNSAAPGGVAQVPISNLIQNTTFHSSSLPLHHPPQDLEKLMRPLTGLQREVLSLYRRCLRACRSKPAPTRPHFEAFTRSEFGRNLKAVDKKDFATIEFMLRKGNRQLGVYGQEGVRDIRGGGG